MQVCLGGSHMPTRAPSNPDHSCRSSRCCCCSCQQVPDGAEKEATGAPSGSHAAQGRVGPGVDREEEAALPQVLVQLQPRAPGLHAVSAGGQGVGGWRQVSGSPAHADEALPQRVAPHPAPSPCRRPRPTSPPHPAHASSWTLTSTLQSMSPTLTASTRFIRLMSTHTPPCSRRQPPVSTSTSTHTDARPPAAGGSHQSASPTTPGHAPCRPKRCWNFEPYSGATATSRDRVGPSRRRGPCSTAEATGRALLPSSSRRPCRAMLSHARRPPLRVQTCFKRAFRPHQPAPSPPRP